ncbi:hypothetical protein BS50DRAFT_632345 [Corynespora cassiicola Philippines]|uniref:Helix-turn-helix domain-containing protein n=1 Tax=Corynespora cassiicola Philippines TaxID=1448308 RepID=A0A2T2NYV8_CORCC|nr:hypothetical protein BS50DRAFT_632345 [Corynespora cassiicola Philippines]
MGSSASKGARAAAGSAARKYPSRAPTATTRAPPPSPAAPAQAPNAGPSVHPPPQASESKTQAIDLDARDPAFASRLNTMGAVEPNPHFSPTSTSAFDPQRNTSSSFPSDMMSAPPQSAFPDPRDNPVLRVLEARQRIQEEAEEELTQVGRRGFQGRKYLDAGLIQLALMRRARGEADQKIEDAMGIKRGRLGTLEKGTVTAVAV